MNQLTKDAIAKALTDLLQERPIEKITIKDITDRCGINRQTFIIISRIFMILWSGLWIKNFGKHLELREISPHADWKNMSERFLQ
ncbi:MAG: TetR/AcrR family transcriptional regulator [Coprococcus sp.]